MLQNQVTKNKEFLINTQDMLQAGISPTLLLPHVNPLGTVLSIDTENLCCIQIGYVFRWIDFIDHSVTLHLPTLLSVIIIFLLMWKIKLVPIVS